jgi:ATP-dependent DNA ligase
MSEQLPTLYNIDSKGKIRTWLIELDGTGRYRTISGLQDGKKAESGWVIAEAKNVGRSNATTPEQQARAEAEADYVKKLERKYYKTLEEAQGAGSGMKFFSPMLANKWKDIKDKKKFIGQAVWSQPKLDGIRCSMSSEDDALSRGGKPFFTVDHILNSLESSFSAFPGLRLDGELYNHKYREDFNTIQSLVSQKKPTDADLARSAELVEYHVYDCPSHPGTFTERFLFLKNEVFPNLEGSMIKLVYTARIESVEQLDEEYAKILEDGYEGQMIRTDEEYLNGPKRDDRLIKRKEFIDEEFPVSQVFQGLGSWHGCAKAVEFILPGDIRDEQGNRPKAGCRGTQEFLRGVYEKSLEGKTQDWYVTVRFPNYTPGGMPRFGVVTAFYFEKRDT